MPARTPDEIGRLFRQYMHDGDLDAVMTLYDREAVFVNQAAELSSGRRDRLSTPPGLHSAVRRS